MSGKHAVSVCQTSSRNNSGSDNIVGGISAAEYCFTLQRLQEIEIYAATMASATSSHLTFEAKKGFVISQTRVISQAISVSPGWEDECCDTGASEVSAVVVENILMKVNRLCQRHNHIFYNAPAIDHVSEQLEVLYRQRVGEPPRQDSQDIMSGQADFSDLRIIERLPEVWPVEGHGVDGIHQAYKKLVGQVSGMAAGLESIRSRHERLLALRKKISTLENPRESVQPNLVFKDGELALELKRMRILAAKLAHELEATKTIQS